ncbi:hypothetical protein ACOMHN_040484 [Nucella lapillus]
MQSEPDTQTDGGIRIKEEPVDYDFSDMHHQSQSEDKKEEKDEIKPEFPTPEDISFALVNPWSTENSGHPVPNFLNEGSEKIGAAVDSDVKSEPIRANGNDEEKEAGSGVMTSATCDAVQSESTSNTEDGEGTQGLIKEFKVELRWSSSEGESEDELPVQFAASSPASSDNASGPVPNASHVCAHCGDAFDQFSHLKLHMMLVHQEELPDPPDGAKAGRRKANRGKARKSVKKNQEDGEPKRRRHVCDVCDKAFVRSTHLAAHKVIHTGQRAFDCDVCGKAFARPGDLKSHKMAHAGEKPYACDVCGKAFTKSSNLKEHKLIHAERTSFACDICGKTFARARMMRKHKLLHNGENPFACNMCNKVFITSTHLRIHMYTHTGERPYKCPHCDAGFNQSNCLQVHIRSVHLEIRPHVCDVCGSSFPEKSALTKHKRIHSGEKPYTCDICETAFTFRCTLRAHRRIHTGEKPYMCDICGNAFSRGNTLKKHKKIHTGNKPFPCDVCGASFTRKDTLTRHKKTHLDGMPLSLIRAESDPSTSSEALVTDVKECHQ